MVYNEPIEHNNIYVQARVSEEEFNINPTHYYIRSHNEVTRCAPNATYQEGLRSRYYTKAVRGFQKVRPTSENFDNNKSVIYIKEEIAATGIIFYSFPNILNYNVEYYLYTNFSLDNILNVFSVTSQGVTSDDLYTYLNKLNSAI